MKFFDKIFKRNNSNRQKNQNNQVLFIPDFDTYDEFGQIISIFDYVLNPDLEIANKATHAVHRLFKTVQLFKNNQLYKAFRFLSVNISEIEKFKRFEKEVEITLLCISSMNSNGYTREKALDRLIQLQTPRSIPFILFRMADWVLPIRKKAENTIQTLLVQENAIYFIQNYKLINWLLRVERNDISEFYNMIVRYFTANRISSDQLSQLNDNERFYYYILLTKKREMISEFVPQMINDKYYLIRLLLVSHLYSLANGKEILSQLLLDKSQKVRLYAINLISNHELTDYQEILENLIYDKSTSVRIEARRLIGKICIIDFIEKYRIGLLKKQLLVGSILGLSEVSDRNEINTLVKYLDSEIPNVRTASLIGIFNLDHEFGLKKAYEILENKNPISIKRAAENILLKQGIDFQRLRILYDITDQIGKVIILRLFNKFRNWSSAGDFLKAIAEKNERIEFIARVFLDSWRGYTIRLGTRPTNEDKEYVLYWYNKANMLGIRVPSDIPFIFGEKLNETIKHNYELKYPEIY